MGKLGPAAVAIPIAELMVKADIIDKINAEKPKTCAALFPKEWPGHLPPLFAPGTPITSWAKAMLNPPKFTGTEGQFTAAFPGFLQQAAQAAGFDVQAYAKESAFVINSVQACAAITPAMTAQATTQGPFGAGKL